MTVDLPGEDWNKVLAILAQAPWATANPLIMAIGEQLRARGPQPGGEREQASNPSRRGNSGVARDS